MTNVIYIGPRLNKGEVMTNELFTDKPAELIARLKEKYPLIELLFVPVDEYAAANAELKTAGSARAQAYAQATKGGMTNG